MSSEYDENISEDYDVENYQSGGYKRATKKSNLEGGYGVPGQNKGHEFYGNKYVSPESLARTKKKKSKSQKRNIEMTDSEQHGGYGVPGQNKGHPFYGNKYVSPESLGRPKPSAKKVTKTTSKKTTAPKKVVKSTSKKTSSKKQMGGYGVPGQGKGNTNAFGYRDRGEEMSRSKQTKKAHSKKTPALK